MDPARFHRATLLLNDETVVFPHLLLGSFVTSLSPPCEILQRAYVIDAVIFVIVLGIYHANTLNWSLSPQQKIEI